MPIFFRPDRDGVGEHAVTARDRQHQRDAADAAGRSRHGLERIDARLDEIPSRTDLLRDAWRGGAQVCVVLPVFRHFAIRDRLLPGRAQANGTEERHLA